MTSILIQMLVSAKRPLSEVLVDELRRSALAGPPEKNRKHDDDNIQIELWLEPTDERDAPTIARLRPDEVAIAILLGRSFDENRDHLAKLLDTDRITIFEAPSAD